MKVKIFCILFALCSYWLSAQEYQPTWESVDRRPVPEWFRDAKFGIFIHWGVYSVPSYRPVSKQMYQTYAEWYEARVMNPGDSGYNFHVKNYGKDFAYRDFAPMFRAELFDPELWAGIFERSGARYVVLTSKHHDGFCMWPTKSPYSRFWNCREAGPKRDLLGDLAKAVRARGLKFGIYYSLMEWESTPKNHEWSGGVGGYYLPDEIIEKYRIQDPDFVDKHMLPQLKELVINYQPSLIFSDGEWDRPAEYWRSQEFLAWLYNNAPNRDEVVVNDRWGVDTRGVHGGYYTSEYASDQDKLGADHPWEESRGMGQSYGFNRAENIDDYNSSEDLLRELVSIVSRGGNLLLNIGPTADGRIPVIMQQRLIDIGNWLSVNGEAIYGSVAWDMSSMEIPGETSENNGDRLYFTRRGNDLYVIGFGLPQQDLRIPGLRHAKSMEATVLGSDCVVRTRWKGDDLIIRDPASLKEHIPCSEAYAIRLRGVL